MDYFGSSLTTEECERIALLRIAPVYRETEAELFTLKWFDYRHLHPVKATYLFAHLYEKAIRDIHAKTKDYLEAKTLVVLDHKDIFRPPVDKMPLDFSFWRARQEMDRHGVRYDFGLDFLMNRAAARGWRVYPRPNQLYTEEAVLDVRDAWVKYRHAVMQTARNPRFKLDQFSGHPDQVSYHAWLLEECGRRESPVSSLSRCFRERHLSPEIAMPVFGDSVVREALRFA